MMGEWVEETPNECLEDLEQLIELDAHQGVGDVEDLTRSSSSLLEFHTVDFKIRTEKRRRCEEEGRRTYDTHNNTNKKLKPMLVEQSPHDKTQLFNLWLEMKSKGSCDETVQALAETFLNPEDLYEHFKEYIPPNEKELFNQRVGFERDQSERALVKTRQKSWLLRRSSYNRREVHLHLPPAFRSFGAFHRWTETEFGNDRPVCYAFSFMDDRGRISHSLIVHFKQLWMLCKDDPPSIYPLAFFPCFIAVLEHLFKEYSIRPERIVRGYYCVKI